MRFSTAASWSFPLVYACSSPATGMNREGEARRGPCSSPLRSSHAQLRTAAAIKVRRLLVQHSFDNSRTA